MVSCLLAVVLVNCLDEDGAFLRVKSSGISKALSCRVGTVAKIKADHPLAMAVDRLCLAAFHLTAQRLDAGDPSDRPFSCRLTPYANRAPPFLS